MFAKLKPNTHFIGQNLIFFNETGSTNEEAMLLCRQKKAAHGMVLVADNQTGGKGQQGRSWHSAAGKNLMFSVILIPDIQTPLAPFIINKAIALAVHSVLGDKLADRTLIKWPNDIYHKRKKIAGILIENTFSGQQLQYCVAGIGINVNENIAAVDTLNATSLYNETLKETDREALLSELCEAIESFYLAALKNEDVTKPYCRALWGYNELCHFELADGETITSKVHDVDDYGRIAVTYSDELRYFHYGTLRQVV